MSEGLFVCSSPKCQSLQIAFFLLSDFEYGIAYGACELKGRLARCREGALENKCVEKWGYRYSPTLIFLHFIFKLKTNIPSYLGKVQKGNNCTINWFIKLLFNHSLYIVFCSSTILWKVKLSITNMKWHYWFDSM